MARREGRRTVRAWKLQSLMQVSPCQCRKQTHFVCSQSDLCWNFPKSERKFALKHHCGSLRVRVWSRDLIHHQAEIRISACDRVGTTEARAPVKDLAPTLFQKFAACVQPHGKLKQCQGPSALHEREAKPQNGLYT